MIEFDDNDHDDDFYRDGGYWSLLSLMIYEDVKDKKNHITIKIEPQLMKMIRDGVDIDNHDDRRFNTTN